MMTGGKVFATIVSIDNTVSSMLADHTNMFTATPLCPIPIPMTVFVAWNLGTGELRATRNMGVGKSWWCFVSRRSSYHIISRA